MIVGPVGACKTRHAGQRHFAQAALTRVSRLLEAKATAELPLFVRQRVCDFLVTILNSENWFRSPPNRWTGVGQYML